MTYQEPEKYQGIDRRKKSRRLTDQVLDELNAIYLSLEYIVDGIIIVNQDASIYFATERAKKSLASVGHLIKLNHKIHFLRNKERKLFDQFLTSLTEETSENTDILDHYTLLLTRGLSFENPLILGCYKLLDPSKKFADRGILIIRDPDLQPMEQWSAFVQQFELTPIELRLCLSLAEGTTLADYCEKNHVTQNTARTQLKKIFEKTGVRRQTDLLRLIFNFTHT